MPSRVPYPPATQGPTGSQGPVGATGAQGSTGATGTTGAAGAQGATGSTGSTGTTGSAGTNGTNGADGAAGVNAFGAPVTRSLSLATAYQASTSAKPALVSVEIECVATATLGSAQANTIELIIGSTNGVASGTGTKADTFRSDLSVSIIISLAFTGRQFLKACLPAGWYFAVRRTVGTGMTISSAFDQTVG